MAFGGLYEWWKDPELPEDHPEKWHWTNTVLTTTASDAWGTCTTDLRSSCRPDMLADWLNPGITDPKDVRGMVAAMPEPHLVPAPDRQGGRQCAEQRPAARRAGRVLADWLGGHTETPSSCGTNTSRTKSTLDCGREPVGPVSCTVT